jgi:hypothetical protein
MNYLVDECFRAEVEKYRWSRQRRGHWQRTGEYGCRERFLHRYVWVISGRSLPPAPLTIDHINRDPSDNRLENLRVATPRLQRLNKPGYAKSGLPKGVGKNPATKNWQARIGICGRVVSLGYYATVEEASAAYEAELARQIEIEEARVQEILNVH